MPTHKIIVFDGVCNLCNGTVNFIIARDPDAKFRFASSQSNVGKGLLEQHSLSRLATETLVYIDGDTCHLRSDAALAIASELTWPWPAAALLRIIPPTIRDAFYSLLAQKRYALFGRTNTCRIPSPDLLRRFLVDQ